MAVIVVGGQAKDVGKTTLVCNIVLTFREGGWTAVKISDHPHDVTGCEMLAEAPGWSILEQVVRQDKSDTARYLQSGAARALLMQAEENAIGAAAAALISRVSGNVIVESNRGAQFLSPDLFLLVVDSERDFKPSAQAQLEKADALVYRGARRSESNKPMFVATENGLDSDLELLIRKRLLRIQT
jgi:molybdopterin-guanine dinucleotide biosynthesis protein